jgi:hypothetical protein
VSNKSLAGAFREAMSKGLSGGYSGPGLSALDVDGRVDFYGEFTIPALIPAARESLYRVFLRDNDVNTSVGESRFALDHLVGLLEQRGGVLQGERVTATLAATPIALTNARFEERDGGYVLETGIEAEGVPIDRAHLSAFFDEATITALLDELAWRGTVDLRDSKLVLSGSPSQSGGEVHFRGDLVPHGMSIDFGVPIEVDSALVHIRDLVYRRDSVRATATVSELAGRVSDRRLEEAAFELVYDDPKLSLRALSGALEKGRIESLDQGAQGASAFEIDLVSPFDFGLRVALRDVEVGGLLRGLFESDFASRGKLSARLELEGDLRRLTGIHGTGRVSMRDTTLWSIPVVRDLLSQLGLDSTAVFESIETELAIDRGVIGMRDLKVSSPLLKLVGEGTLDFDGSLHHDLEVRYAILDQLGWFNRIFYAIQNSLARIAVRGDMARPRVELKGVLGSLRRAQPAGRDLPLPELAPLSARF